MKTIKIMAAALVLLPAAAYAADKMDCCKDCACCQHDEHKQDGHKQDGAEKPKS